GPLRDPRHRVARYGLGRAYPGAPLPFLLLFLFGLDVTVDLALHEEALQGGNQRGAVLGQFLDLLLFRALQFRCQLFDLGFEIVQVNDLTRLEPSVLAKALELGRCLAHNPIAERGVEALDLLDPAYQSSDLQITHS